MYPDCTRTQIPDRCNPSDTPSLPLQQGPGEGAIVEMKTQSGLLLESHTPGVRLRAEIAVPALAGHLSRIQGFRGTSKKRWIRGKVLCEDPPFSQRRLRDNISIDCSRQRRT